MLERPELSLALHALRALGDGGPRDAIEWAGAAAFRWVTLDAGAPGLRARELDRSARRDLASLLRRLEIGLAGMDLWIPPAHYVDAQHADRAMDAVAGAIDLVAELSDLCGGSRTLSILLPRDMPATGASAINARAGDRAVRIADHAWPIANDERGDSIAFGLDPAALLTAGENPAKVAARIGDRVAVARLTDSSELGRVEPGRGEGRLNDLAYTVALDTAKYAGPVVLDARGLPDPRAATMRTAAWWRGA